jgi:predicted RNA-binding protein YlxR (DUF448 family)
MSKKGHIPIRTCIGCRKKRKKEEMIWLAQRPEGMVVVNGKKPHQGRGLYLCPDHGCLTMAKKKKRGVGFLERMDFRYPSAKGFLIEEVGNGKK